MSKKDVIKPGHFKLAGRVRPGKDTVTEHHKQDLAAEKAREEEFAQGTPPLPGIKGTQPAAAGKGATGSEVYKERDQPMARKGSMENLNAEDRKGAAPGVPGAEDEEEPEEQDEAEEDELDEEEDEDDEDEDEDEDAPEEDAEIEVLDADEEEVAEEEPAPEQQPKRKQPAPKAATDASGKRGRATPRKPGTARAS